MLSFTVVFFFFFSMITLTEMAEFLYYYCCYFVSMHLIHKTVKSTWNQNMQPFPMHIPDFSVHNLLVHIIPRKKYIVKHNQFLHLWNMTSQIPLFLTPPLQTPDFTLHNPINVLWSFFIYFFCIEYPVSHLCQIKYNRVSCWLRILNIWKQSIALIHLLSASVVLMPFSKKQFRNLCCLITHDELQVICHVL